MPVTSVTCAIASPSDLVVLPAYACRRQDLAWAPCPGDSRCDRRRLAPAADCPSPAILCPHGEDVGTGSVRVHRVRLAEHQVGGAVRRLRSLGRCGRTPALRVTGAAWVARAAEASPSLLSRAADQAGGRRSGPCPAHRHG